MLKEMEKSQRHHDREEDPLQGPTDSQILKLGQAALRKTQQNAPAVKKQEPLLAAFSVKNRTLFLLLPHLPFL